MFGAAIYQDASRTVWFSARYAARPIDSAKHTFSDIIARCLKGDGMATALPTNENSESSSLLLRA